MFLVKLKLFHYAPKDGEEGIKEFLIADDQEKLVKYIDKVHFAGSLKDAEEDGDEDECYVDKGLHKSRLLRLEEAKSLGLKVEKNIIGANVSGLKHLLIKWYQGNSWEEVTDAYYGVSQYEWDEQQEITEEQAQVLLQLGVAKDIRDWKG